MSETFTDNAANFDAGLTGPATHIAELLHSSGYEAFDASVARELLANAVPDDAMLALDYVNAAVTETVERPDHTEKTSVVGKMIEGQHVVGQLLLAPRHRHAFMAYTLDKARSTDNDMRLANVMAYGTVLAHNFADGNGRTARVVAAMIAEGFDPSSADSVANINLVATSRDNQAVRQSSFVPDISMRRSWVAETVSNDGLEVQQADAITYIEDNLTSTTNDGRTAFIDGHKIESALTNIKNDTVRTQLRKALQQFDFGALVLMSATRMTGGDIKDALGLVDDAMAADLINYDEDIKFAYSKNIIDIAAGESKPYYSAFGTSPDPTMKISDEYLLGYH